MELFLVVHKTVFGGTQNWFWWYTKLFLVVHKTVFGGTQNCFWWYTKLSSFKRHKYKKESINIIKKD
jgi:hypothetical protein